MWLPILALVQHAKKEPVDAFSKSWPKHGQAVVQKASTGLDHLHTVGQHDEMIHFGCDFSLRCATCALSDGGLWQSRHPARELCSAVHDAKIGGWARRCDVVKAEQG
eukprot:3819181-Amphidinium_carterae.2